MPSHGNPQNLTPQTKEVKGTRKLNLRERKAIAEYIKTGNKTAAYRAVYNGKRNHSQLANNFFRRPKIRDALEKALKESKFDDAYAVDSLKKIVEGGMANLNVARPDVALKGLETYFKLTHRLGGDNQTPMRIDPETQAKRMSMTELQSSLKEIDKKQKRILAIIGASQEGEVIK